MHRIRSLVDLCDDVVKGTLGGYVESYENLSQEGDSWVGMDAVACEDAYVSDDAILTDCAIAKGSSYIGKMRWLQDTRLCRTMPTLLPG